MFLMRTFLRGVPEMFVTLKEVSLLLDGSSQGEFVLDVLLPTALHDHVPFFEGDYPVLHYLNDRLFSPSVHQVGFCEDSCEIKRESYPPSRNTLYHVL